MEPNSSQQRQAIQGQAAATDGTFRVDQGAQLHLKGGAALAQDSREAGKSPSSGVSENRLEGAMADQSQRRGQSCSKQEVGQETPEGPLQPVLLGFCDLLHAPLFYAGWHNKSQILECY